jgi:NADH-quinone oxidoreductase subunit M
VTLSILVWLPAAVALIATLLPRKLAGWVTALGSLAALAVAIGFVADFDTGAAGLQRVTDVTWISELGVHYKIGLDGLNVVLVLVTAVLFFAAILGAILVERRADEPRPRLFYFHLALAESAVLGAFCAQDLLLFVAFFDLMLVPFYFLTGQYGGAERVRATTKLVIYTLVGSLLMLAAAIATGVLAQGDDQSISFVLSDLAQRPLANGTQDWIFLCFAAAFLVKMPAFPVHGWLPDAYRNMPLPALAVFSGVLSKVAAYGFLKICMPLFPHAAERFQTLILLIALASILYGSAMAFTTTNLRLVVAYSSVAQLGFITLGIFALERAGAQGALLQSVNHALVTVPLFFIVGLLALRAGGSEDLRDMGGFAFRAPVLAAVFLIVSLATLAMPGSTNFVGEFLILLGTFREKTAIAVVAFAGVALAAVYMLRAFIGSMHNNPESRAGSRELRLGDAVVLVPLVGLIVALSLFPQFGLERSEPTVNRVVAKDGGLPNTGASDLLGRAAP